MTALVLKVNQETLNRYVDWVDSFKKRLIEIGASRDEIGEQILLANGAIVESGLNVTETIVRAIAKAHGK
jgi:hypothetical protein